MEGLSFSKKNYEVWRTIKFAAYLFNNVTLQAKFLNYIWATFVIEI